MPDVTATEDTDELFNVEQKTKKNALEYMMSRANKRTFPALKPDDETRRFTKKDELYNEVVKIFPRGRGGRGKAGRGGRGGRGRGWKRKGRKRKGRKGKGSKSKWR